MMKRILMLGLAAALVGSAAPVRAQPAPIVLRIATPGNDGNALAFYAQDMGFFKKYGIDGRVQTLRAGSGAGVAAAVAGGAADIGEGDIVAAAAAREHGIAISLLSPSFLHRTAQPITALVVARNSPIRSARDLDAKVIGEPSLTGPAKIATVVWLQKNGADVATIKFVEVPQVNMAAAVARGTIAAAVSNEPSLTATLDEVRPIGDPYGALGDPIQVTAWFATDEWLKANPDAAKRFVSALHETAVWANNPQNYPASGAILQKYTPFPPELLAKMHRATYGETFDPAIMQPLLDAAAEQKSLPNRIAAKDLLSPYALIR
jgi:NitT/TauT family transport system substrate-binding protein